MLLQGGWIGIDPLWVSISCNGDGEGIGSSQVPWMTFSVSENNWKRLSKESGWSLSVQCWIEYMVRNENAAEVVFA